MKGENTLSDEKVLSNANYETVTDSRSLLSKGKIAGDMNLDENKGQTSLDVTKCNDPSSMYD